MSTVKEQVAKLGLEPAQRRRLVGNLKVAGITEESVVTAHTSSIIKNMAQKLKKRGITARTVAEPTLGEHDRRILAGEDPATGDKIPEVIITKNRKALYNPETRVTYPFPNPKATSKHDEV